MPHSGQNIRFQVLVNGEVRGTARLDSFGVLAFYASWVRRNPTAVPDDARAAPDFTDEEWAGDRTQVRLGGLDSVGRRHLKWFDGELAVGDEVAIRVLPPGELDPPAPMPDPEAG